MKTFSKKDFTPNVSVAYDLTHWALPLGINHWWNPMYGCKTTIIYFLCFGIRILHKKKEY